MDFVSFDPQGVDSVIGPILQMGRDWYTGFNITCPKSHPAKGCKFRWSNSGLRSSQALLKVYLPYQQQQQQQHPLGTG